MAITLRATSGNGGPVELPKAGTYKGLLVGIYDLGTQDGGQFSPKHQVLFLWEIFRGGRPVEDSQGNRQIISKFFTLSLNEKASLRAVVETIMGRALSDGDEFNIAAMLGSGCRLQVVEYTKQNGKPGVKVAAIMALDEDELPPKSGTDLFLFEIAGTECEIPNCVPSWVAEIVRRSPEWQGTVRPSSARPPANGDDEDIPY